MFLSLFFGKLNRNGLNHLSGMTPMACPVGIMVRYAGSICSDLLKYSRSHLPLVRMMALVPVFVRSCSETPTPWVPARTHSPYSRHSLINLLGRSGFSHCGCGRKIFCDSST